MPSELNLTESWPFQSLLIIRHKKPWYPFVDYPRAEFPGLFLTGPANGTPAKRLMEFSRLEKLFFFIKTSDRSEIMHPMATALHLLWRRSFR